MFFLRLQACNQPTDYYGMLPWHSHWNLYKSNQQKRHVRTISSGRYRVKMSMEHPPPFHQDTPNHFQGIVPVSLFPSVASKATLKIFSMALQRVPAQKDLLLKCAITHNKSLGIQDRTDIHSSISEKIMAVAEPKYHARSTSLSLLIRMESGCTILSSLMNRIQIKTLKSLDSCHNMKCRNGTF
jgi:hypothetical protein